MNYTLSPNDSDFAPILIISLATIGFLLAWFISFSPKKLKKAIQQYGEEQALARQFITHKVLGIFFMGILPSFIVYLLLPNATQYFGLGFQNIGLSCLYICGLMSILLPFMILTSKKIDSQKVYPPLRLKTWTRPITLFDGLLWALYLLSYEILFRGLLLFICAEHLGVPLAITISIALYAATHTPKGAKESFGAIPLGFLFSVMTFHTGTIWAAFVIHFLLAFVNDLLHVHHSEEMAFEW